MYKKCLICLIQVLDEIKKLLDREVIKSEGKGRSTHYVLVT